MAPSAISRTSTVEDENSDVGTTMETSPTDSLNGDGSMPVDQHTKVYTDAYTHGYTEGYIHGNGEPKQMPIAIIGMSCRLPGDVTTPAEFWELCSRARTGWSEIPKERFQNASFHHPNPGKSGCFNAVGGNFLKEDLGLFDAPFFSLTAQEATSMDPQQRILLECTFEALESAGIPKHQIIGKDVGVFIGGSFSEYESQLFADSDSIPMHQATGCAFAMQSNRISHFFDLRGPSFTMDTACSSSLVALHQACQSLRNGESKSAIVGGCHLNMLPEFWISFSKSRLFSDEGRSFSFDNRGTGYGRGEGCGMVILKPLDQALKDNDIIRSVIVASGINQDGKTPGITMPNGSAQESLMKSVYQAARIDPRETGYVEAHGTGTKVGDPIEVSALHNIFGDGRTARNPLFIGSVKSNIGHLEAASGIVSVIKAAMMLERGFILPNYDFKKPNEKIPFAKWNLKVPISQRPWPRPKRFASVNNFGFGGTNAHVVLEKGPFLPENETENDDSAVHPRKLFVLSANDKNALEAQMKNLGIYLEQRPEVFQNDLMSDVAYTLGQRRSLMQWRVAISSTSSIELIETLNSGKVAPVREIESPRIGFVFTGQGAQWNAMGRELYDRYPVFASTIDACDRYLSSLDAPFSLLAELQKDSQTSQVNEAHISQPACTAIQLALTDLLRAWGVSPSAVVGHSSGEIGAAYAAGILSLEPCMAISYHRGMAVIDFRKNFPGLKGSMMAVGCTADEIQPFISQLTAGNVRIACFNSPTSLTISGDEAGIDELHTVLEQKQIFNRKLQVDVAYHSHHMNMAAKYYRKTLESLDQPKSTSTKFYSSLVGHLIDGSQLGPQYWVDNLTQAVRFSEALTTMCRPTDGHKTGVNLIVEIGPHSALAGPIKQILKASGGDAMKIPYASALVRKKDAVETALELASTLFLRGAVLDMGAINLPSAGQKPSLLVDMPRYPWNHQTKYWHESRMMQLHKNRTTHRNDLLGALANYSNELEPTWKNLLRIDDLPWLRHHKIQSLTLFPMSGFLSMAIEAASQRAASRHVQYDDFELRDVVVSTPLMLTDEDVEMTLQLRPYQEDNLVASDCWDEFRIHSWTRTKGFSEHCRGIIAVKSNPGKITSGLQSDMDEMMQSELTLVAKDRVYDSLSKLGVSYGSSFQGMNDCHANSLFSKAKITAVDTASEMPQGFQTDMIIQPAFLEQLVEMYWPILGAGRTDLSTVYLPSSIAHLIISRDITELTKTPGDSLHALCKAAPTHSHPKPFQASMLATAADDPSKVLIVLENLTVAPIVESNGSSEAEPHRELCYKLEWEPVLESPLTNGISNGTSNGTNGTETEISNGIPNGSSEISNASSSMPTEDVLIIRGDSGTQICLASKLADQLEQVTGKRPDIGTLSDLKTEGKLCLFLADIETPLLPSLTLAQFESLQSLLTSTQGILWVVRGAYLDSSNPDANMITGLSRSIRSETMLKFATLDLDAEAPIEEDATIRSILDIFKATFAPETDASCELEFAERKGKFFTPRIVNDKGMNEFVHKQTKGSLLEPTKFGQNGRSLEMVIGTPGNLDTLHFIDQSLETPLPEDEIEIEVKAIGLNPRDALAAAGQLDHLDFGIECSGVVTKIGAGVTGFALGNRIAGISVSSGVFSTYARIKAASSFIIRDDVTFESATSIPVAYCTAQYSLVDLGRLQAEDRLLIYGADSAAGEAAIRLAQLLQAKVVVTINNVEARESLKSAYGLRDDQILSNDISSTVGFRKAKFDMILKCESITADTQRALWSSLASFGHFIEVGKQNTNFRLETSQIQNRSFASGDLISLATEKPKALKQLVKTVSDLLNQEKIKPISSINNFSISDVGSAFKALQSGTTAGKIVVSLRADDEVKATPSKAQSLLLRPDASYILIGGTGGLGRTMARWMVSKGARNLVLVSRSGSATGKVKELIDEVAILGAKVAVHKCDVTDSASVQKLIGNELSEMPPIKGVVHGAMVLKDVLFEKMAYEQYTTVIESKVKGAWNFHNALKSQSLDFFVAISSAAGAVGNRGQAAYSAANTFLNAFVQYRIKLGLPASSIDLTAVSDAGYLAENAEAAAEVSRNLGSDTICKAEVLALLGAAIDGRLARACNSHTITGMRITSPPPFWTNDAKFKHLRIAAEAANTDASGKDASISFNAALKASRSPEEAQDVVCRGLLSKLPSVLMVDAEDMDVTKSLSNYALDSLVAIEVRNYITREFEANLQVLELLSSGSIESLAKTICTKSKLVSF